MSIITRNKSELGLISRNYTHKNLCILPDVKSCLESFGISVSIYVTFTDKEWNSMSHAFRSSIINVGPLFASSCVDFYKSLDGLVFPSLLECFSVSPFEASKGDTEKHSSKEGNTNPSNDL